MYIASNAGSDGPSTAAGTRVKDPYVAFAASPHGAPQEQPPSDDDVMWQTLLPLKTKAEELHRHMDDLQAQLVIANVDASGIDRGAGVASLVAQAEQAEALWKQKQQEAADAEAAWNSLKLAADSLSKVESLQAVMADAESELAALRQEVLQFFNF